MLPGDTQSRGTDPHAAVGESTNSATARQSERIADLTRQPRVSEAYQREPRVKEPRVKGAKFG